MMFSLPSYRRLSEADLARLRREDDRHSPNRGARVFFNLLLLAGLWGLPFYLRSLVHSAASDAINPRQAIIGRWQSTSAEGLTIEFSRDGDFRLSRRGFVGLTAHYHFDQWDEIVLYDLNPPRIILVNHEEDAVVQYRFMISFTEEGLIATAPRQEANESLRERQRNRLGLPPPFDSVAHFKRVQ